MKLPAGFAVVLASLLIFAVAAPASPAPGCGRAGVTCSQVRVPLDASGQVPGEVVLHVEELKAVGHQRGVMFLLAGGPGQAASQFFDLAVLGPVWRSFFPGYTLVAFDVRGSGSSDALTCKGSRTACIEQLNPTGAYYSTADNARDLDAVRQALGFKRISLWGISYGTQLALAYAQAFPSHSQRLLLDSVVSPLQPDPFAAETLQRLPARLNGFCEANACRSITANYSRDVVTLANDLAAKPLQAWVRQANGRQHRERLNAHDFIGLVIQTDLDPGLAAEMPAAVRAARQGQPRPLLRLLDLVSHAGGAGKQDVNDALNLATNCDDGSFPWQPATPLAERPALLQSALASLPNSSFGGLGSWARDLGTATECLDWPISQATTVAGSSTYPDIPVLALSGGFDLRTPTSAARGLVSRFPHGQLLRVANTGHSVLTSAPSSSVARSVRSWLTGREISQACAAPRLLAPLPSFPKLTRPATHTATLQQITETIHEAEATWLLAMSESGWQQASVAGLTSGRLAGTIRDLTLSHYGTGNGLEFSGKLHVQLQYDRPIAFEGILRITGQGATHTGTVYLIGKRLTGILDHKLIRG